MTGIKVRSLLFVASLLVWGPGAPLWAGQKNMPLIDPGQLRYPPLVFKAPTVAPFSLANGMRGYFLEDNESPLVRLVVVIRVGSLFDPKGKEGLAELTARALRSGGASDLASPLLDEKLAAMGAHLAISMTRESCTVSLSLLKEDLADGLFLLFRLLRRPAFETDAFGTAQNLYAEELRRIEDEPDRLAFRTFNHVFYGDTPQGRMATVASVKGLSRDDVVAFHRRFFLPDHMTMGVAGDRSLQAMTSLLEDRTKSWRETGEAPPWPGSAVPQAGRYVFLFKDVPQSVVVCGWPAPIKKDPGFYPAEVLDFLLGSGGFRSRIFQEIRTKRGLAYSTGSFYRTRQQDGLLAAYAMTKAESTAEALVLLLSLTQQWNRTPLTDEDLRWARQAIANRHIFSFSTPMDVVLQELLLAYEDLPHDFISSYPEKILNVQRSGVNEMAKRILEDRPPIVVVIGNEDAFRALKPLYPQLERIEANP